MTDEDFKYYYYKDCDDFIYVVKFGTEPFPFKESEGQNSEKTPKVKKKSGEDLSEDFEDQITEKAPKVKFEHKYKISFGQNFDFELV